jgi:hypothetical protein
VRPDAFFQIWGPRLEGMKAGDLMKAAGYRRHRGIWLKQGSPFVADLPPEENATARTRQREPAKAHFM